MIILGISLLRLGDLILQKPLIEGLKKKYPQCEIHLLVNKQFAQAEFLFSGLVDRFIYFDRELLQKSCGENEFNIFWGLQNLKTFIEEINKIEYDRVYNFTHNRLTAHLAGMIKTKKQVGIYSRAGVFFGLNNPWIQFFNSYFGRPEAVGFHYTELLAKALEIPIRLPSRALLPNPGGKCILLQPLTSDSKKNWGLEKFKALVNKLEQETTYRVQVLGAPFEKEILERFFPASQLLICDLQSAVGHLAGAELLITGDTSIKHLAALYAVPTIELSLGSSQPLQVGTYAQDGIILESRVPCGPCPHSQPCSQATHLCAEKLSVAAVFSAVKIYLGQDRGGWSPFTRKYPDLNIYRTAIRHIFGWTVESLTESQKNNLDEIMQRKMMIVEELDRRQQSLSEGVLNERTRKLPDGSAEAP